MSSLVWISGASAGIGAALAAAVPYPDARVIDLSRRGGTAEHFQADLSEPADWVRVEQHFAQELSGYDGERVVFIHNAGTITPIGPAHDVDAADYTRAVLLNSAAPQVLGRAFLRATAGLSCERHLVMLSSGAAKTAYAGWSSYNAGKAAVEQWVRTVGQEQDGCRVIAVAPGVVDTAMQTEVRATAEEAFPAVGRFHELKRTGALSTPAAAAAGIWSLLERDLPNGSCVDLRDLRA
ncbi:NAD(P)-dependent dehydrogenase (short-subunit alcohol dehydrogenase family) [Kribbella antiqua]|uniref:NAD(P)-dependent dehydrogenase (Short-subunit alcohol dehydrogenase family) n=1 Tax=Kribbella antiqua TaxID=2512217 RepID=A0A4R2I3J2_9ACTN|nr:SDR family NAD(P)-dependent oxidoreductase [Kribbella antiqua]TCO38711.1 NAD(P)-dependent dehydrogenase (short-subunit alcohol dehydrogenase family) [Kribbella antiqua]